MRHAAKHASVEQSTDALRELLRSASEVDAPTAVVAQGMLDELQHDDPVPDVSGEES